MENEIVGPQKEKNRFSKAELLERVMNLVQSRKTRLEIQEELGLTKENSKRCWVLSFPRENSPEKIASFS